MTDRLRFIFKWLVYLSDFGDAGFGFVHIRNVWFSISSNACTFAGINWTTSYSLWIEHEISGHTNKHIINHDNIICGVLKCYYRVRCPLRWNIQWLSKTFKKCGVSYIKAIICLYAMNVFVAKRCGPSAFQWVCAVRQVITF